MARLMTMARDDLSRAQTVLAAAIEAAAPALVEARDIVDAFLTMVRQRPRWTTGSSGPPPALIASFACGLAKDRAPVHAAIATAWSNAQAEGQLTKLKLVKRQMYGRSKLDLLQARVIASGA